MRQRRQACAQLSMFLSPLCLFLRRGIIGFHAKGVLQRQHGLSEEEAYLRLRSESRRLRRPMRDLADAIILAADLGRSREAEDTERSGPEPG